jgi:hypothetical protein
MRKYRASTIMKTNHYFYLHHHLIKLEAPHTTTSSTTIVEASQVEREIISNQGGPSDIQKTHPPQQIIGNLNERII